MSFDVWHSLVILGVLFLNGRITIWTYHWNNQRRETKFLKALKVENPDSSFSLVSVSGRDDTAFRKIKEQLREQ